MEKIKNFFSKHGLIAFITLFLIMGMRGCIKNSKINKLENNYKLIGIYPNTDPSSYDILQFFIEGAYPVLNKNFGKGPTNLSVAA